MVKVQACKGGASVHRTWGAWDDDCRLRPHFGLGGSLYSRRWGRAHALRGTTLADRPQVRWEAKDILELVQVYQQGGSVHNV